MESWCHVMTVLQRTKVKKGNPAYFSLTYTEHEEHWPNFGALLLSLTAYLGLQLCHPVWQVNLLLTYPNMQRCHYNSERYHLHSISSMCDSPATSGTHILFKAGKHNVGYCITPVLMTRPAASLTRHSRSLAGLEMMMRIFLTSLVMTVTSSLSERSYAWPGEDKRMMDYCCDLIQLAQVTRQRSFHGGCLHFGSARIIFSFISSSYIIGWWFNRRGAAFQALASISSVCCRTRFINKRKHLINVLAVIVTIS